MIYDYESNDRILAKKSQRWLAGSKVISEAVSEVITLEAYQRLLFRCPDINGEGVHV